MSLLGGKSVEPRHFLVISRKSGPPRLVERGEIVSCVAIPSVGSFAVPVQSLHIALRHAFATAIHRTDLRLGGSIVLRGGFLVPGQCRRVVPTLEGRHSSAVGILRGNLEFHID